MQKKSLICIVLMMFQSSCAFFRGDKGELEEKKISLDGYSYYEDQDYLDQLSHLGDIFLKTSKIKKMRLSSGSRRYLVSILNHLQDRNELFFTQKSGPKVYILKTIRPIFFSIPKAKIFLSTGFLKNYIKHEGVLQSALAYELVKSLRGIYKKNIQIPIGHVELDDILATVRLTTAQNVEINKWAYYIMRRANLNYDSYLSWLQLLNKNSYDFYTILGGTRAISQEEFLFKQFLIKKGWNSPSGKYLRNSRQRFYNLMKELENI